VFVLVALVTGAAACGGGGDGDEQRATPRPRAGGPTTTTTTTSTTVPSRPSKGCGTESATGPTAADPVDVPLTFTTAGSTPRTYRLAVPTEYDPDTPVPLVFNFHGLGSNAIEQSVYSGLPEAGRDGGLMVVTPDAVGGVWQFSSAADPADAVDVAYVRELLADLEGRYCVDTARVYAAGMSLGALMSASVACALPGTFGAIGLVAVQTLPGRCEPVPVVVFHGTDDQVVPYQEGGEIQAGQFTGVKVKGTINDLADWAELDGCAVEPDVDPVGEDVQHRVYPDCGPGTEVELYTVVGGGHTWPGSEINIGPTTTTIDATALILEFFAEHPVTGD